MIKQLYMAAMLCIVVWASPSNAIAEAGITVDKGLVTITAEDIQVRDLLKQVAERSGVSLLIVGGMPTSTISFHVHDLPVENVFQALIPKGVSFVSGFSSQHQLVSVTIFGMEHAEPLTEYEAASNQIQSGEQPILQQPSELFKFIVRQEGRAGRQTAAELGEVLADRTAGEVNAKLKAIKLLVDMGTSLSAETLENGLGDDAVEVRSAAVAAIYQLKKYEAINLVAQAYFVERNSAAREKLLTILEQADHPLARQIVVEHSVGKQ